MVTTQMQTTRAAGAAGAATEFHREIATGRRYEFGKNWARFLRVLDEQRILTAQESLQRAFGVTDLCGKAFLDIGCGSGLFSLAACRLGARVRCFDFDPQAVACARALKRRYFPDDGDAESGEERWIIEQGSVLDDAFLRTLGSFDVVYSWGVLHHTGAMWHALENARLPVAPGGALFISIYNDLGWRTRGWWHIKRAYNRLPRPLRLAVLGPAALRLWGPPTVRDFVRGTPFARWRTYCQERGMSPWTDVADWVGGFPFEVAKPEQVFDFYRARGFELVTLKTCAGGIGCNEYVFRLRTGRD